MTVTSAGTHTGSVSASNGGFNYVGERVAPTYVDELATEDSTDTVFQAIVAANERLPSDLSLKLQLVEGNILTVAADGMIVSHNSHFRFARVLGESSVASSST